MPGRRLPKRQARRDRRGSGPGPRRSRYGARQVAEVRAEVHRTLEHQHGAAPPARRRGGGTWPGRRPAACGSPRRSARRRRATAPWARGRTAHRDRTVRCRRSGRRREPRHRNAARCGVSPGNPNAAPSASSTSRAHALPRVRAPRPPDRRARRRARAAHRSRAAPAISVVVSALPPAPGLSCVSARINGRPRSGPRAASAPPHGLRRSNADRARTRARARERPPRVVPRRGSSLTSSSQPQA